MASDTRDRPRFAIFAGPNGAGKSTAYRRFLDARYNAGEYLNPDDVAAEIAADTGTPAGVDLPAGRVVIQRTRQLIESRQPFTRETTLSGRENLGSAARAGGAGLRVVMVSRDAVWVERATAGLPLASALLSRDATLAQLRNTRD